MDCPDNKGNVCNNDPGEFREWLWWIEWCDNGWWWGIKFDDGLGDDDDDVAVVVDDDDNRLSRCSIDVDGDLWPLPSWWWWWWEWWCCECEFIPPPPVNVGLGADGLGTEPFDTGELRNAAAALDAAKFCKPCARIFGGNRPCIEKCYVMLENMMYCNV